MRVWPVKGSRRIIGIPDAAFRNNSGRSSQRAMTTCIADERVKGRIGETIVVLCSLSLRRSSALPLALLLQSCMLPRSVLVHVRCFEDCARDISGMDAEIHIRTDANNLATTASTTHGPEQQETIYMIQMLRKLVQEPLVICHRLGLSTVFLIV